MGRRSDRLLPGRAVRSIVLRRASKVKALSRILSLAGLSGDCALM